MSSQPDYRAMSFRLGVGGCAAVVPSGPHGQPAQCPAPPTRCGLLLHRMKGKPAETWLAFACETHSVRLIAARELLDRDRGVLQQWRAESDLAQAGRPWRRPAPLARGADAVQLADRARRWAEASRP